MAFTKDKNIPLSSYSPLEIYVEDGISGPTNESTLHWFDAISPHLPSKALMILDRGKPHTSPKLIEEMEAAQVEPFFLPAAPHALLSPLDNSLNAIFRRAYYKEDRSTHEKMLIAIKNSLEHISATTIEKYFDHVGITSEDDPEVVAQKLYFEGYHPTLERDQQVDDMISAFRRFKLGLRT